MMTQLNFSQMREAMVDSQLRTSGVHDAAVVAAMAKLPRENFVSAERAAICYMDRGIALSPARMLNAPVATGMMLQEAAPSKSDSALLIGAGSGYVAAILAGMVGQLVALESDAAFEPDLKKHAKAAGNMTIGIAPLDAGQLAGAPYSLIVIDGAIEILPESLVEQLADGGRIVTGICDGPVTRLAMGVKRGGAVALRAFADVGIAILPEFAQKKEFVF